jgi:hypothetical protein
MRYLILILLLAASMPAAESDDRATKERLEKVAAEVARRKAIREAQELIRAHEAGEKKATEEQLAAARALLSSPGAAPSKQSKEYAASLPDAPTQIVAQSWKALFGEELVVGDRAKTRGVNFKIADASLDGLKRKFEAALRVDGLVIVKDGSTLVLEVAPNPKEGK